MIIILVLSILIVIGIGFSVYGVTYNSDIDLVGIILVIISSIILFIALILLPISRMETYANIKRYKATIETLKMFRENGNEYEKATLINKVIEINQDLEELKYYNETIFDIWIPDEINDLKLIK